MLICSVHRVLRVACALLDRSMCKSVIMMIEITTIMIYRDSR